MQQIIPRITVPDSRAAAEFYRGAFGGGITEFYTGENGGCTHAALSIKPAVTLYFADGGCCGGITLSLALHDAGETRRLFDYLSRGGEQLQPLAPAGWALLAGSLRDKYGVLWEFNCGDGDDAHFSAGPPPG